MLSCGQTMPDLQFRTPFDGRTSLDRILDGGAGAVVLLRYAGCPLCQLYLHRLAAAMDARNERVVVVLQSHVDSLRAQTGPRQFPFTLACDPEQALYRLLGVPTAADEDALVQGLDLAELEQIEAQYPHGAEEGEELQLPAAFLVDGNRSIHMAHYGQNAADLPPPELLLQRLRGLEAAKEEGSG